jgi:hypothetical protein
MTITATDMRENGSSIGYSVSTRAVVGSPAITLTTQSFSSAAASSATFNVSLASGGAATAGDYEGFVEITGGGQTYTVPYFVRVQDPAVAKDILLIDWDRSNTAPNDFRPIYEAALTGLGLSYDVFNGGTLTTGNPGPTYAQLQNYRAVVFFTGNNTVSWANAHVGGSFPLQDYLVAGGKLVMTGQDLNSQVWSTTRTRAATSSTRRWPAGSRARSGIRPRGPSRARPCGATGLLRLGHDGPARDGAAPDGVHAAREDG